MIQDSGDEKGERKTHAWSGMAGGRVVEEAIQCFESAFYQTSTCAERCSVKCECALIAYMLLKNFASLVHPKNIKHHFKEM